MTIRLRCLRAVVVLLATHYEGAYAEGIYALCSVPWHLQAFQPVPSQHWDIAYEP